VGWYLRCLTGESIEIGIIHIQPKADNVRILANPIAVTEANLKGISHIAQRMTWYWELAGDVFKKSIDRDSDLPGMKRQLQTRLVDLYKALLSYQMRSICSYYRHRGLVFLRDLVNLDNWDGELRAVRDAESDFQRDFSMFSSEGTRGRLGDLVGYTESEMYNQCLKDLRITDPRLDKKRIEQDSGGILPACLWIFNQSLEFDNWRQGKDSSLLRIQGAPGKGKTMLLCGVIDQLECGIPDRENRNLAYYFLGQDTDPRINNAISLLRGLIYMLVREQPSLLSYLRRKYDDAGKSLFEDANAWIALSDILEGMLQDPNLRDTYLIIDALDECTDLPKLLEFVGRVLSSSARLKILLASHASPDMEQKLGHSEEMTPLCLEKKDNADKVSGAVDIYIEHGLARLALVNPGIDQDDMKQLRGILGRKAEGTFLWVSLVTQELETTNSWDVLAVAEEIPAGLQKLYHHMVSRIQNRHETIHTFA
jgi:hypothetical protein